MIYLEFIERDRWVPIEVFRHIGNQDSDWAEGAKDRVVLQLGRTLRLGPRPSYLCLWDVPDIGRLDVWEDYFASPAAQANPRSLAMHRSINIDRAGLYDVLHEGSPGAARLHVVEYIDPLTAGNDDITEACRRRARQHESLSLLYVLRRLGHLGPEPPLLVIWSGPTYAAAEPLLRSPLQGGTRTLDVGIYRSFGKETL